jgi:hypothetical protein
LQYLLFIGLILLSGCTSSQFKHEVVDGVLKKATGKDFSRNSSQCIQVKRNCSTGNYEEWVQVNGKKGCACN